MHVHRRTLFFLLLLSEQKSKREFFRSGFFSLPLLSKLVYVVNRLSNLILGKDVNLNKLNLSLVTIVGKEAQEKTSVDMSSLSTLLLKIVVWLQGR